jgi:DNA-binding response OmpR family regulator
MSPIPPLHVLVVDDEPALCELTGSFLSASEGIEVDAVCSVADARTAMGQKNYDVIVSDYQMPKEDGIQFLKSLRGRGEHIPFILFTGKGREDVVIEALNNGADSYLQKGGAPQAQFAELEHMIRIAVERKRSEHNLFRLNECLVSLEADFSENLQRITSTGGELLRASFALYSRISGEELLQVASWKTREGRQVRSPIKNSLCYEVVRRGANSLILEGLQQSPLAETVPSIRRLGISTFLSHVVRHQGRPLGMLCVGYTYPASVTEVERRLFGILAKAIEAEEERRLAAEMIGQSESRYRELFENMQEGYALCSMIFDKNGTPEDFLYMEVNASFERIVGKSGVAGRRGSEVFPGMREKYPELIESYGRVALTGKAETFDFGFAASGKWLRISVFSSQHGRFVVAFSDISDYRKAEQALVQNYDDHQTLFLAS